MAITAADVNKLRQQTGAGMMDCKKALTEANGNFEEAIDILRKKGQKVSELRAGKEANEGLVIAKVSDDGKRGIIVTLNCETDFVALNEDFKSFVQSIADTALNEHPDSLNALKELPLNGSNIAEKISEQTGVIGEKLNLSNYVSIDGDNVIAYNHAGNKIGVLVSLTGEADETVGKDLAMQVAAMNPHAIDKDDVDASTIEREMKIAREQAIEEGKPAELAEKIALGKVNKFYAESTLLNQKFVKDNSLTVRQMLEEANKDLHVTAFKRVTL